MLISYFEFNDSRLRACLDVGRYYRAMISNVLRACRVHGAEPESTENRMVWRTPVSQPSACVAFGARRRWRSASLLGSPGPSRSTKNTVKCAALCTRVSRTPVCVSFGARGLAATPLGRLSCTAAPPSDPSNDHTQSSKRISVAKAAHDQDQPQSSTAPQGQQQPSKRHSGRICSVGGRAMHMEWPDGIGREAGNGKTRHVKELSLFRACPW